MVKRLKAKRAFLAGESDREISRQTGVSKTVWERALRTSLGDAEFEHQLAINRQQRSHGGRPRRESPAPTKPADQNRRRGKTVPVVIEETGEVFGSMGAAAKALGLPYHQVRASVFEGSRAFRPDGATVGIRRWREGDPELAQPGSRQGIVLRFSDGSCWPSVHALAKEMGARPADVTKFCRKLKSIGYGPEAEPLPTSYLRELAGMLPLLERQRLEDRINAAPS